jgi:hypothetical protein
VAVIWLGVALALFAVAFVGVIASQRRARRDDALVTPIDLGPRIEAATRAFADAAPWRPAVDHGAPESASAIEAALIADDNQRALETAEHALAAAPQRPITRVWLAWALCANGQPAAALDQLAAARAADAELTAGPLASYLAARAEHLQFEHATGATAATPALITTADLAVVTLARGRGATTWLRGTSEQQLSATQARGAIAEHRAVTARCLARALDALEAAPGFTEAAYLVARLALKAGLIAPGRALFGTLTPRMVGRPDAAAFARDLADLADPASAVAAAKLPPAPRPEAKRSRRLKVL